jgi:hypothetical protein
MRAETERVARANRCYSRHGDRGHGGQSNDSDRHDDRVPVPAEAWRSWGRTETVLRVESIELAKATLDIPLSAPLRHDPPVVAARVWGVRGGRGGIREIGWVIGWVLPVLETTGTLADSLDHHNRMGVR